MPQAFHDATLMWLFGAVLCALIIFNLGRQHIEKSPTARNGPLHNRYAECAHTSMVEDVHHLRTEYSPGPHWRAGGVRGSISFLAMREYMTLVPTRRGDHRTLFWSFFVIMPLQYYLVGAQRYGLFCDHDSGAGIHLSFQQASRLPATRRVFWNAPRRSSSG